MDIKLPFSIDETPGAEYTERRIDIWRTIIADYQKIESDARHVSSMLRESTDVNGVWKQLLQLNETCNTISELAEESERTLESALLCTNALHNLEVAIDRHSQKIADLSLQKQHTEQEQQLSLMKKNYLQEENELKMQLHNNEGEEQIVLDSVEDEQQSNLDQIQLYDNFIPNSKAFSITALLYSQQDQPGQGNQIIDQQQNENIQDNDNRSKQNKDDLNSSKIHINFEDESDDQKAVSESKV